MEIMSDLTIDDYYRTDTHWRQERILDVARRAADTLGAGEFFLFSSEGQAAFTQNQIKDFYGVYYGQAALPMDSGHDRISHQRSDRRGAGVEFGGKHAERQKRWQGGAAGRGGGQSGRRSTRQKS